MTPWCHHPGKSPTHKLHVREDIPLRVGRRHARPDYSHAGCKDDSFFKQISQLSRVLYFFTRSQKQIVFAQNHPLTRHGATQSSYCLPAREFLQKDLKALAFVVFFLIVHKSKYFLLKIIPSQGVAQHSHRIACLPESFFKQISQLSRLLCFFKWFTKANILCSKSPPHKAWRNTVIVLPAFPLPRRRGATARKPESKRCPAVWPNPKLDWR